VSELFDAVDALVASRAPLPPPEERRRLRKAHGLTVEEVAAALKVRRATVSGWESGKTEPRPPERDAYARLLKQLAQLYPAPVGAAAPAREAAVPKTSAGTPAPAPEPRTLPASPASDAAATTASENPPPLPATTAPPAVSRPARTPRPSSVARRPGAQKAAPADIPAGGADPRFANGPLAVVDAEDGQVLAYCVGGLVLDVPAKSLPALVEWTLKEAKLGQPKLSGPGKDADPLLLHT
jgi:transcriptional regulator with XRE-family HTH domain